MTTYYIHTFATEDKPEMICAYDYYQYKEVIASLKASGIDFITWHD